MIHNKQIKEMSELTSEQSFEIQEIAKIGYWEANLKTGELFWSKIIFDIFGYDVNTFIPTIDKFKKSVHPDDVQLVLDSEKKSETTGLHDVVHRIITPTGDIKYVHELAKRYMTENQDTLIGTVQDVTEFKLAQQKIENLLKEKETTIKEMYHRIKNNLQQIHSLLGLQAQSSLARFKMIKNSNDNSTSCQEHLLKIISDIRHRIFAISIIHQMFYKQNTNKISFIEFLNQLFPNIEATYSESDKEIKINISGDKFDLCLEHIVPCGLIVNEIISNSFKHAFVNRTNGNINIDLKIEDSNYIIKVSDDGIGISDNNIEFNSGMGMSLIYGLTEQIGGEVKLEYDSSGTKYEIKFDKKYLKV